MFRSVDSMWTRLGIHVERMFRKFSDLRQVVFYNQYLLTLSTIKNTVIFTNHGLNSWLCTQSTGPIKVTN